jgi:hypothetical protein
MKIGAHTGAGRVTKGADDDPSEENQSVHREKI